MNEEHTPSPPTTLPAFLSLFTSAGTLVCCALPALLVSIGAGTVMAGLIDTVPQITWFGKNRNMVFALAGMLLLASGLWQLHARTLPCPADRLRAAACARARRLGAIAWSISAALFVTGVFFAYFAASVFF